MNVFFDTNVLLDVFGRREPFFDDSARVWALAEKRVVAGFISVISVPNMLYILRKVRGAAQARQDAKDMRNVFTLAPLDALIVNQAIDSEMPDFEDAIQYHSAVRVGASVLITRNTHHFPAGELVVQTPTEFLATYFAG